MKGRRNKGESNKGERRVNQKETLENNLTVVFLVNWIDPKIKKFDLRLTQKLKYIN